jgi:molecular chaperone DnaK
MVEDAEAHAEEDRKFHETVTARNNADAVVHATRSSLKELGEKISDDDRKNIESAMESVEEAMKGDDKDAIEAAVQKLTEAAQVIYEQAAAEAQADQANSPGDGDAGGEDVVDAEFEEVDQDAEKPEGEEEK